MFSYCKTGWAWDLKTKNSFMKPKASVSPLELEDAEEAPIAPVADPETSREGGGGRIR